MESRVNYTAVGIFVILFTVALVGFAFWLGKYSQNECDYRRYHVYMKESVSGLSPEAAVKFHGVNVGTVEEIRINPLNSEEVILTLKIKKETPIKTDSAAVLKFYGITGLAFIEIVGGTKDAPPLASGNDNSTLPIIPSAPSLIQRLDESLSNVASRLSTTLERADRLFDDTNVDNVAQTLQNLRTLTERIEGYQAQIKTILEKTASAEENATQALGAMREAADGVKNSSRTFDTLMQTRLTTALESLESTSRQSRDLIRRIETTVERGDYDVRSLAAPTVSELNALVEQSRSLADEMDKTLRTLRESPSDLLFKTSTPKPGPGEQP